MNRVVKNTSWIVICKVAQSLLSLMVSMLTARYLGPSNYGVINYAASIVAFMLLLMQIGLRSTLVYEFQAIDYCVISVSLLIVYKKCGGQKFSFSFKRGREMLSKSKYYIISGMMVTIFAQTDRLMIKNMIDDTATGYYSAAVTCVGMASFVFAAIIDSIRPVILESKEQSIQSFELSVSRLFSIVFYMSLIQCVLMTIPAKPIIWVLYGNEYLSSVDTLRLVVWYVTYSYIGQVRNIWILAEKKQKYLMGINLAGALLNVLINICFIPVWGIIGAAIASVITQFFTNFLLGFIIKPIKDCNRLMLKGMNPKFALGELKRLIKKKARV